MTPSTQTTSLQPITVKGIGLITGRPITVTLTQGRPNTGIIFDLGNHILIPAQLTRIANTERGVTLSHDSGQFVAIVEHFLCACAFSHITDLHVAISGGPELPLLDGSAAEWMNHLAPFAQPEPTAHRTLTQPLIEYIHNKTTQITATPDTHFKVTYHVSFDHPELNDATIHWDSVTDEASLITRAQTFGHVDELPALQAKGLAKGVTEANTLGLIRDGGYTRPLYVKNEPVYHKALDLIGDLMLGGINALETNLHVTAICAGHSSHTAFAKLLATKLT